MDEFPTENGQLGGPAMAELMLDIRRALTHLYDWVYLQQSPLASLLGLKGDVSTGQEAKELRRFLLEAIEQLAPLDNVPLQSPMRRRYAALKSRYVEQQSIEEISAILGLSERQVRRELRAGIEAIASIMCRHLVKTIGRDGRERKGGTGSKGLSVELEALRIDSGAVNLCAEVRNVAELIRKLAHTHHVLLRDEVHVKNLVVQANRIVLRQVLLSLYNWAVHTAEGGVVSYRIEENDAKLATLELTLTFGQGESDLSAVVMTDIMAPELLEALNAVFRLEVRESGFTCKLSLATVSSYSILLIDDNRSIHKLFQRYLSGRSYLLLSAYDAVEGLRLARKLRPDVIVLDIMIPEKDGWELIHELQADRRTSNIPILICTVLNQKELAHSLGVAGYITKPVTQNTLLSALQLLGLSHTY